MTACTIDQLAVGCDPDPETWVDNGVTYTRYSVSCDYLIDWDGDSIHCIQSRSDRPTIVDITFGRNCDLAEGVDISRDDNYISMFKLERII